MMLTEVTAVPAAALPVFQFRDHLRLGTGFTDTGLEDGLLETYLRAAIAAVEAWTGKALIARSFVYEASCWTGASAQALPVAPVQEITALTLVDADGAETLLDAEHYGVVRDTHRPELAGKGALLPSIPTGGVARITLQAGFGASWTEVPADLAHAVLLLAAYYHEYWYEARMGAARIPYGVSSLISSWRPIRLGGRDVR
ncbi:MAG: hypothetical protein AAF646_02625 [Pseudomonadota bacterium]